MSSLAGPSDQGEGKGGRGPKRSTVGSSNSRKKSSGGETGRQSSARQGRPPNSRKQHRDTFVEILPRQTATADPSQGGGGSATANMPPVSSVVVSPLYQGAPAALGLPESVGYDILPGDPMAPPPNTGTFLNDDYLVGHDGLAPLGEATYTPSHYAHPGGYNEGAEESSYPLPTSQDSHPYHPQDHQAFPIAENPVYDQYQEQTIYPAGDPSMQEDIPIPLYQDGTTTEFTIYPPNAYQDSSTFRALCRSGYCHTLLAPSWVDALGLYRWRLRESVVTPDGIKRCRYGVRFAYDRPGFGTDYLSTYVAPTDDDIPNGEVMVIGSDLMRAPPPNSSMTEWQTRFFMEQHHQMYPWYPSENDELSAPEIL
ncbi:hypothetical protein QBC47DRAFT_193364 [Echria macrotheca]|uniref:Uncharacterized protein n=1 Tax=Echria macrotheca TaxID=438768 RepID=A0AAJ0BEL3_9PEZI|nr:hypothetical protein QBC47DRAFT_193364 [Echria macrotheca]